MQADFIKNIILGIIQGLTEFLPVSSSGHLVIFQKILGVGQEQLLWGVILHLGTAAALIVFFRKDILKLVRDPKLIGRILLVTAITCTIAAMGKDFFEGLFASAQFVGVAFFITGAVLLLTKKFMKGERLLESFTIKDAVLLGLAQGFAIIPGISRSGITISLMLFLGVKREEAFRFSFLAAIPAILGALVFEARNLSNLSAAQITNLSIGSIAAFLSGLLALHVLKRLIHGARFSVFGYYCIAASAAVWFLLR